MHPERFVYGELGRVPMSIIHKIAMVKYWLKIVHGRKPNIVNAVYQNSLRNLERDNKPGWTWYVKDINSINLWIGGGLV